jgi:ABC-type uncharacterized transport system permease subunit
MLGQLAPRDIWVGFGAQALWLLLVLAALRVVWRAGVKQYSAVGQ